MATTYADTFAGCNSGTRATISLDQEKERAMSMWKIFAEKSTQ